MIGNLSGLKAVVFFYGDSVRCFVMREQFVGRDRRESLASLQPFFVSVPFSLPTNDVCAEGEWDRHKNGCKETR